MTTYTLRKGNPETTRADVVVIGVAQSGSRPSSGLEVCAGGEQVAAAYGRRFGALLTAMGFTGRVGEVVRVPTAGTIKAAQLLVVGTGPQAELTPERVRRCAGVAARNLGNAASVALALPADDVELVRAVAEGFVSGTYAFAGYRSTGSQGSKGSRSAKGTQAPVSPGQSGARVSEVAILSEAARRKDAVAALESAQVVGALVHTTRDWVNTPPNELTPAKFADAVRALHKQHGKAHRGAEVGLEVLDVAALEELGCGGILGVGQGSDNPPCLVRLTWRPEGARGHVALVGKGITYDSGGLTIKPGSSMTTMKNDMAGAAAVITALYAVAALELPVAVTAWAPMAENMVSGAAMRPGDVLTTHCGKTVEVLNTDAEGRLVLADALSLAAEEEPDTIIDVATLTGPCVVALGDRIAGLFGTDDAVAQVDAAARSTGELVWRLPIPPETREAVRTESKLADVLQHNWVRWGSALWAAAFLQEFTAGRPWAHLDIAGPAWNSGGPWGHVPSGGTGYAVSTLVEYVAQRAAEAPAGPDAPAG